MGGYRQALPALDVQTPPNPADNITRMVQLKSLLDENALRQQLAPYQVQQAQQATAAGELENQQRQQQINDQKAMTAAMQDWDGKDYNDLLPLVKQHGASATAVMGLKSGLIKQATDLSNLTKDQLANEKTKNDYFVAALDNVESLPEEQRPAAMQAAVQDAVEKGHLDPKQAQGLTYQGQDQIDMLKKSLMGYSNFVDSVAKKSQAGLNAARAQDYKYKIVNGTLYDISGDTPKPALSGQMDPQAWGNLVDSVVPPAGANQALNARTKAQVSFYIGQGNAEAAQKAITEAGQQVGSIEKETNPSVLNARVGTAVATEVGKAKALAPELQSLVRTTSAGRQYVSAEDLQGDSGKFVRQQAATAGIPVVDKDTASTLTEIDTAKANQDYMLRTISGKLASGAGSRLLEGPENTIEKMAQSDPQLAAVGTYRNAAIQSMRAVAGSKGLRINQYEVQMAIDNDIPKMTDTLPVAQQKLTNLKTFLDNSESAHLTMNRSTGAGGGGKGGAGANAGQVQVKAPNGKIYSFPDQASADRFKKSANIP